MNWAAEFDYVTVVTFKATVKEHGISWPLDVSVTNAMLKEILFPKDSTAPSAYVQPDFPTIHKDLVQSGMNRALQWTEYCDRCRASNQVPYMYTQFYDKY